MKAIAMERWKLAAKVVLLNTAFAFVPPILVLVMSFNGVTFRRLLDTFLYSLVYAHSIGTLNFATIPKLWGCAEKWDTWLRWFARVAVLFANTLVGSILACIFLMALGWIPRDFYWPEFWGSLKIATFISILAGLIIGMYESFKWRLEETTLQLRTKELERERALKLATEAQLASLESRIHPHFLFNTLNSISSLIPEDPQRAERLVEQMAALLRFSLDAHQAGLVPLADEMKVVSDYLDIERVRFGDRLRYRIDVPPDLVAAQVPPLSVQTLVENSVKFAIAPNRSGGEIDIAGTLDNGHVKVEISDAGPAFTLESAPPGHGLDNLKDRLSTLFGSNGTLKLERRDNRNRISISVPAKAVPTNGIPHARISG